MKKVKGVKAWAVVLKSDMDICSFITHKDTIGRFNVYHQRKQAKEAINPEWQFVNDYKIVPCTITLGKGRVK
jgi:hypothetical protein